VKRYPDVNAGTELLGVSRAIFNDPQELIVRNPNINGTQWMWTGPEEFDPRLKIISHAIRSKKRGFIVNTAIMVILDDITEYRLRIERHQEADVPNDPYTLDFVEAFRQYEPHSLLI
jgi:hypothetical protein